MNFKSDIFFIVMATACYSTVLAMEHEIDYLGAITEVLETPLSVQSTVIKALFIGKNRCDPFVAPSQTFEDNNDNFDKIQEELKQLIDFYEQNEKSKITQLPTEPAFPEDFNEKINAISQETENILDSAVALLLNHLHQSTPAETLLTQGEKELSQLFFGRDNINKPQILIEREFSFDDANETLMKAAARNYKKFKRYSTKIEINNAKNSFITK